MTVSSASSASARAAPTPLRRKKPADRTDIIIRLTAAEQETLRAILAETDPGPPPRRLGPRWLALLVLIAALLAALGAWLALDPAAAARLHGLLTALRAVLPAP